MRWFGFYVITIAIAVLLASCLQSNEVDLEQEQSSKDKKESSDISTNSSSHTYSSSFQIFKPSSADWIESSSSENQPTSSSSEEAVSSATPVPQWKQYTNYTLYSTGLGDQIMTGGWWFRRMSVQGSDTARALCPFASNDTLVSSFRSSAGYYPVDIECETANGMTFEFQIPPGFPLESTAAGFECVESSRDSLGNLLDTAVVLDDYCNLVLGRTLTIQYSASDSTIMRLVSGSQPGTFGYLFLPPGENNDLLVNFDSLRYSDTDSIIGADFWRNHIITGVEFTGNKDGSTLSLYKIGEIHYVYDVF